MVILLHATSHILLPAKTSLMFWSVLVLRTEANDILAHNYIAGRSRPSPGIFWDTFRSKVINKYSPRESQTLSVLSCKAKCDGCFFLEGCEKLVSLSYFKRSQVDGNFDPWKLPPSRKHDRADQSI